LIFVSQPFVLLTVGHIRSPVQVHCCNTWSPTPAQSASIVSHDTTRHIPITILQRQRWTHLGDHRARNPFPTLPTLCRLLKPRYGTKSDRAAASPTKSWQTIPDGGLGLQNRNNVEVQRIEPRVEEKHGTISSQAQRRLRMTMLLDPVPKCRRHKPRNRPPARGGKDSPRCQTTPGTNE